MLKLRLVGCLREHARELKQQMSIILDFPATSAPPPYGYFPTKKKVLVDDAVLSNEAKPYRFLARPYRYCAKTTRGIRVTQHTHTRTLKHTRTCVKKNAHDSLNKYRIWGGPIIKPLNIYKKNRFLLCV
eukprot:GEMP01116094.1.p1 GENE.GEMP01116094.1~~GEMP01116094.1.p1  ORF type:complete len:129 (-),score=6.79 GEMP01116094.1:41-427(-)